MKNIKLTSYGATEEVTGSCHLLNINGYKILIDCGFFQGGQENYFKNWDKLDFNPRDLNSVILTHAHLDHCGRLPILFAGKYKGNVYATRPTIKLAQIVLEDNLRIMQQKARKNKLELLYSPKNLSDLNKSWKSVEYYTEQKLNNNISFKLYNAGHILGSAIVEIKVKDKIIVFSGDLGQEEMPLIKNIDYLDKADYIVMEGTYGDRLHEEREQREKKLIKVMQRTALNNSVMVVSSFAIERTQNILEILNNYYEKHIDFNMPVFLDSPMATSVTKIYKQYLNLLNEKVQDILEHDNDLFNFPHLKITNTVEKSKNINISHKPKMIIAGSGMMEGGRILHHLARYVSDYKNNIVFTGFQVPGTLGHKILTGSFDFHYNNRIIPIKANIEKVDGFSAHGDMNALLNWLNHYKEKPHKVLLVHGNKEVLESFSNTIKNKLNIDSELVKYNKTITLN